MDIGSYELICAVGDLVARTPQDPDYDVRRIVTLLVTGLRHEQPAAESTEAPQPS